MSRLYIGGFHLLLRTFSPIQFISEIFYCRKKKLSP